MSATPGLLVSVRSADEVKAALAGGADLIDVKEPAKGPLAPAEAEVVAAVIDKVGGRVPVSAALGEWSPNAITDAHWHLELKLDYFAVRTSACAAGKRDGVIDAARIKKWKEAIG